MWSLCKQKTQKCWKQIFIVTLAQGNSLPQLQCFWTAQDKQLQIVCEMEDAVILYLYTGNEELVILTSQCMDLWNWTNFNFEKCFIRAIHACDFRSWMGLVNLWLKLHFSPTQPFHSQRQLFSTLLALYSCTGSMFLNNMHMLLSVITIRH